MRQTASLSLTVLAVTSLPDGFISREPAFLHKTRRWELIFNLHPNKTHMLLCTIENTNMCDIVIIPFDVFKPNQVTE